MHPFGIIIAFGFAAMSEDAAPVESGYQAPSLAEDPAGETERCRQSWSRGGRISGEISVTVWLNAEGRVTGVATPPDTDPLSAQAAQCAVLGLQYEPAVRDDQPVAANLVIPIGFITPPDLARPPEPYEWRRCYPRSVRDEGLEGRIVVEVTIGADGKLVDHSLPADAQPWLIDAANCMVRRLEFMPGLRRGVPVEATAKVPLFFKLRDASLDIIASIVAPTVTGLKRKMPTEKDPAPVSTEEEIIAAYRDCYPSDHGGTAKVTYQITVSVTGVVGKIEVVKGSGDARLDEAGACILRKLKFRPATINGRGISSTVRWPLLVRPPP